MNGRKYLVASCPPSSGDSRIEELCREAELLGFRGAPRIAELPTGWRVVLWGEPPEDDLPEVFRGDGDE